MAAPMKRALRDDAAVAAKISTQAASDSKLNDFLQWCRKHQFNISPKVQYAIAFFFSFCPFKTFSSSVPSSASCVSV
jgi:hypothetical protein